jgi:TetR/AcrR family transcriptional regulator, lmrAB and yxaGH operons repressor
MAHRTISDQDFLDIALDLFRTYGFEGVSIKRLADAAGLEKASLYHRYPGGKDEIVMAVATEAAGWFQKNVFDPLAGPGPAKRRILQVSENLRSFYANGTKACICDVLSIPGASEELRAALRVTTEAWITAFAGICRESGLSPSAARSRAEEAILRIEGALVLSRVLGDNASFERVLKQLPELLTAA